jgi:hypothetical protein
MPRETKDIEEGPISTGLDGAMLPTNPIRRIAIVGAGSADCGNSQGGCPPGSDGRSVRALRRRRTRWPDRSQVVGAV